MTPIKRRHFLQFTGSALAALGMSQLELHQQALRYAQVLAQTTPRKLALLVGINDYPNSERFRNLHGCVNDVELQRNLLVHRFGFNAKDIKTLTDSQATREGILITFEEHLINQAQPGDVVVFHFSGHGSRVLDPEPIHPDGLNSTFVPSNDISLAQEGIVNDLMGQTLFLLMYALKQKTENVTVVLDSCHAGGGTRGNIQVRAVRGGNQFKPSPKELEWQQQWRERLKLSPQQLQKQRQQGVATGVVIASAKRNQYAADYSFSGFHAGAFTYLLTQQLWQQSDPVRQVIERVTYDLRPLSAQIPEVESQSEGDNNGKPIFFLEPERPSAEAAILEVNGNRAQIWLGGVPRESLDAFSEGATFVTLSGQRGGSTEIEIVSRDGLVGEAIVKGIAQWGDLLQEAARAIPKNWTLHIGLDPSLNGETAQAKAEIDRINRIQAIPSEAGNELYPQEVHYILSRMTPAYRQQVTPLPGTQLPPEGSIGLFSPALEIIPSAFGEVGETVTEAVSRLNSKLKSLLAARIVKMTLNAQSSRLDLGVTMKLMGQGNPIIAQAFTPRGCKQGANGCRISTSVRSGLSPQQLVVGDRFQFQVINREDIPLYLGILLMDPSEGIVVLFPNQYQGTSTETINSVTRIDPNQTLEIPDPKQPTFQLVARETGVGEVLIIASQQPISQALLRLNSLAREQDVRGGPLLTRGNNAVEVIDDLINDLSTARGLVDIEPSASVGTRGGVSAAQIAALSITFEIVN